MRNKVTQDWQASYADPIRFGAGDRLILSGREDLWDGHLWLWATGPDGREGWVPDTLVMPSADGHVARAAYSAAELSCRAQEILDVLTCRHGWAWCRNARGGKGWVPLRNLCPANGRQPQATRDP